MRFFGFGKRSSEDELRHLQREEKKLFLEHQEERKKILNQLSRNPDKKTELEKILLEVDGHYRARFDEVQAKLKAVSQKVAEARQKKP